MQSPFFLFALFMFGLAFGSFLNVIAFRYDRCETANDANLRIRDMVGGRSKCMKCKAQLRWYELLPLVSFAFLRGRCGTCREKISWQYPIVELISGLIFVFVFLKFLKSDIHWMSDFAGLSFAGFWIFVFLILLLMSIIDLRHYIIPDALNFALFVSGFLAIGL